MSVKRGQTFESGRFEQESHGNRSACSGEESEAMAEMEGRNQAASVRERRSFSSSSELSCCVNRRKSDLPVLQLASLLHVPHLVS